MSKSKTYIFKVSVTTTPYTKDTVENIFGKDATYNPDFPEDILAKTLLDDLIQDAIRYVMRMKMMFMSQHQITNIDNMTEEQQVFWDYLNQKQRAYEEVKFVKND